MISMDFQQNGFSFESYCDEMLPMILELYSRGDFDKALGRTYSLKPKEIDTLYEDLSEEKDAFYFLIKHSNMGVIGFIKGSFFYSNDQRVLWIKSFGIIPTYRRAKLGSQAINILLAYMKLNKNIKKVFLSVSNENISAIKFWKFNLFNVVKRDDLNMVTHFNDSVTIMKKCL